MRRRRERVPSEPWGVRIDRLIRVKGWSGDEAGRKFGVGKRWLQEVRWHGGRPRTDLVVRLRKLEELYADDLAALDRGEILKVGSRWVDFRGEGRRGEERTTRPADLAPLGQG